MKYHYLIATCLCALFYACNDISETHSAHPSFNPHFFSRTTENPSFPDGATALFHISGALEIINQTFTYSGDSWENGESYEWNGQEEYAYLTAIYPAMKEYSYNTLYTSNRLEDILISQDTIPTRNQIEIKFRHLFSSLTIHMNELIQKELQEIKLTTPAVITSLDPSNGQYITEYESHTVTEIYNETSIYSFILPPMTAAELTLQLIMQDGNTYTHTMAPHTFRSGYSYECNILKEDQRPGIKTVEDLITFSLLINKQNYTGEKTLADFGEEVNGQTVYRLLNDLTLNEEQSKELLPIGYYDSRAFQDVFDGEGHRISNLILPDKSINSKVYSIYSGLFGHIGTNGVVKNLHIHRARSADSPTCTRVGVIAALNEGQILNCSVEHSSLSDGKNERTGFITGQLSAHGHIVNCHASNDTLTASQSSYVGGICGYANGNILNCFTANNQFNLTTNYLGGGGIAGYSSASYLLNIINCYTYYQGNDDGYWSMMESAKKVNVENFFYNNGTLYNAGNSSGVIQENVHKYDSQFTVNGTSVANLLNNWVIHESPTAYPDFTFNKWSFDGKQLTFE